MANIIKNTEPGTASQEQPVLDKAGFGSEAVKAAVSGAQEVHPHHHEASVVELRENETREIIALSGGSITGGTVKSNKQLTQQKTSEALDAWKDPNRVDENDDVDTALQKRLQRAATDTQTVEGDEQVVVDLNEVDTRNEVTQNLRNFGNFHVLEMSPELFIVMGGLSETFDNLLASKGMEVQDPTKLSDPALQAIFDVLQKKRSKLLSEEEKEAELMMSGAVAILAIPQILEKLEELGLDVEDAKSIKGMLAKLLDEVQDEGSTYHNMYLLIKEETELSKIENDELEASA